MSSSPISVERKESYGRIFYNQALDQFSAEVIKDAPLFPSSPIGLAWIIIGGCNLKCIHCYGNKEELPSVVLSTRECFAIVDRIIQADIMRVVITGGEPLLRDDIFAIIERLQKGGISVVLGTNGTFINSNNVYSLKNCTRVEISLDAATAELKNKIRPSRQANGNAWNEALAAITLCLDAGVRLRVLTALNEMNQHHIVAMAGLLATIGVQDWALSWTIPAGRAKHIYDQLRPDQKTIEDAVKIARSLMPGMTIRYSDRMTDFFSRYYCLALPDGQAATEDVALNRKISFGSLLEHPFAKFWNNENYNLEQHFRKWVSDRIKYIYNLKRVLAVCQCPFSFSYKIINA